MVEAGADWMRLAPIALALLAWIVGMLVILPRKSQSLTRELAELEALNR